MNSEILREGISEQLKHWRIEREIHEHYQKKSYQRNTYNRFSFIKIKFRNEQKRKERRCSHTDDEEYNVSYEIIGSEYAAVCIVSSKYYQHSDHRCKAF